MKSKQSIIFASTEVMGDFNREVSLESHGRSKMLVNYEKDRAEVFFFFSFLFVKEKLNREIELAAEGKY